MFKVSISNSRENKLWEAKFASEELAQAWLAQQVGKPHRLPEREVAIESEYFQDDVLEVISEDIEQFDENFQSTGFVSVETKVKLAAEFVSEISNISVAHALDQAKMAARKLLADTDWLVIREMDSGVACSSEIKAARAAAREIL